MRRWGALGEFRGLTSGIHQRIPRKQLQGVRDDALTMGDGTHHKTLGGVQGGEDDNLRRMALKVCFVEDKEMSMAVSWA